MIPFGRRTFRTIEVATSMSPKPTQTAATKTPQEYSVGACVPGDLSDADLATCVEIVRDGGAVVIGPEKFQKARMLAVARNGSVMIDKALPARSRMARTSGAAFVVAQRVGEQTVTEGTSPAASGPAGSLFERQVGAFYLLSLFVRAEPRAG
jgi:hypothetical protein